VSNSRVQQSLNIIVNHPPVAYAISERRLVSVREKLLFEASDSMDHDGKIRLFLWDMGDGTRTEGEKITHGFEKPGKYSVRLRVADDSESVCNSAEDVIMIRVNASPVAKISVHSHMGPDLKPESTEEIAKGLRAYTGGAHDDIIFDATDSYDPDGDPLVFVWDFGDGTKLQGAKVRHRFRQSGKYAVKLSVNDGTGLASGISWEEIRIQVHERK
jgi:PKD repeat protein